MRGWSVKNFGRETAAEKLLAGLANSPSIAVENLRATLDPEPTFVSVNPVGTYLDTDALDSASDATYISLESLGLSVGDSFWTYPTGEFKRGDAFEDFEDGLTIGVFVDGNGSFLEPGDGTTAAEVTTEVTDNGGAETDISEDFSIGGLVEVVVPEEAMGLLFSVNDSYFSDNSDPDNDFGVYVDTGLNTNSEVPPTFFSVDETSTYLYQEAIDAANSAGETVIDLTTLGLETGDIFQITRVGDWAYTANDPDTNTDLTLVFSDGFEFFAPGVGTTADEVYTVPSLEDPPVETDLSEDMLLSGTEYLVVPEGATELWVGVFDSYFADNFDFDNNLGVVITAFDPGDSFA